MNALPSRLDQDDLSDADAVALGQQLDAAGAITIGQVTVPISDRARTVLAELLAEVAAGHRVDVVPVKEMLSTQEAADLLRVSRPTLVKMLEDGLLPFERPGSHRRVPRAAVDIFLESRRRRRERALDDYARTGDGEGPDQSVMTR